MTKIVIADDHPAVLEGVKSALSVYHDVEVVGVATGGGEAVEKVRSLRPQIVIMDIEMPDLNGIEATCRIKKIDPKIKVIIHTMHSEKGFVFDLMKAGISAYVLKQNPISDLHLAIQVVKRGGTYLCEDASAFFAKHTQGSKRGKSITDTFDLLSPREREVFQLVADGLPIKKIAKHLRISIKTVEAHKYRIMDKLQIRSTAVWTKEAVKRGLIEL